jgi:hypothetical protein
MAPAPLSSLKILADSWTVASAGYNQIFVPKFAPWTQDSIRILTQELETISAFPEDAGNEPSSSRCCCYIPCCGPGKEIEILAEMLRPAQSWSILGVDLAPGMVELARERLNLVDDRKCNVEVRVGNAMEIPDPMPCIDGSCSFRAVLCIFGLQQLPDPVQAIRIWVECISSEKGGVLVVCYWPQVKKIHKEDEKLGLSDPLNPWSHFGEVIQAKLKQIDDGANGKAGDSEARYPPPESAPSKTENKKGYWEDELIPAVLSIPGAELVQDTMLRHSIEWQSAEECFESMTMAGPWHALRLKRGDEFVDSLKEGFCAPYPTNQKLSHAFEARLLVIRRRPTNPE